MNRIFNIDFSISARGLVAIIKLVYWKNKPKANLSFFLLVLGLKVENGE